MESKLNYGAIEQYASQAAERLRHRAYADTMTLDGHGILAASPVPQVNYLVLHQVFRQWQEQLQQARSPYFQYKAEEVKEAERDYADALSRNIALQQLDYQELAKSAIVDAVCLIFSPYDYYLRLLNKHSDHTRIGRKELKDLRKYLKVNDAPIKALIAKMKAEGKKEAFNDEALRLLDEALEEGDFSPVEIDSYLSQFSEMMPLDLGMIYHDEGEPVLQETAAAPEPVAPEPVSTRADELSEEEQATLNDQHAQDRPQTLAEAHEKQPSESIKSNISINRKFMFINELFDGEADAFAAAVKELDTKASFDEAMDHIHRHISKKYAWKADSEAVGEFLLVLEKRFPSQ